MKRISAQMSKFKAFKVQNCLYFISETSKTNKKEEYFNYLADYILYDMPTVVRTHMNGAASSIHAKHTQSFCNLWGPEIDEKKYLN